ncbi:TAXI family TRAP transporter solute-binding subunit [Gandjariella thermophila]|uniref:C4-dicarboxylate ABC transporter substrate-binding protein n=1 Tax=Gandjariella thermophila TaxID=1931992 RepID=A0A4D4IZU5_9PSEU|nr:TAXI family TRAP transporter solute-binding subunit [Gandjariella thermophila]GDY28624.1 C4-dicarboxylate ABC transporter substrate-binding protein [Gandjariella thermophila]
MRTPRSARRAWAATGTRATGATRRAVLRAALAGATASAFGTAAGCAAGSYRGPDRPLMVAAGEPGGFYLAFAEQLATAVSVAEPRLHAQAAATEGSQDNIAMLRDGRADLALVLADSAVAAFHGQAPFGAPTRLRALGRVYENYLQLVVRADGQLRTVADLAGHTAALGAAGSGAAVCGDRMVAVLGLRPGVDLSVVHLPLADAVGGLVAGRIDALLWSGGVPTPALAELDERVGIHLLPLNTVLPELRARYGRVYEQVPVPSGAYRLVRELPTVGVANLLLCRPELADDLAAAVVRVLVRDAGRLVPQQALGTQFLDARTLIGTGDIPLHPGAAAAYRELHG